ncbi:acetyl-CoA carboxylase, carboxyltransferase subunit beta [Azospirillum thermophilum]|uniref:Acetyl-coenzyme A carboxylase carboxyl transferase subunit beta n=1 Tax=Azospirillum thermophilum TaxID=2202148 RepID=A0A2S2CNZ6_9PROT|nr:acetyl-CoA carboxylase, carboxyltransferase subunit beta [Azospirillum thermophilum]AWK86188.1 acetyl-CoA carboxylase carboxyl transferase subunit beta [Azospirillum thermophilum]
MNWLTNYVRPKIRALYTRKEVPDNLWHKCPSCEAMLFHRELEENLHVCQHCGFHMRLDPVKRLASMFDEGQYETVELPKSIVDPLKFRDQKRYTDRLKEAQTKTGRGDAIVVGSGPIGGQPSVVAAFDFGFMGGSMGIAVGEGLLTAARKAVAAKAPLIVVPASGGARMQEGILSLMQMPRTTIAVEMVKEAGLPYIVVLTDPTTGGVTASFAMLGDIHIAEKGAQIGFAGARVIESTIRETLPEGFQRSEYLLEHGMVDMVVHRRDLRDTLARVIGLLMRKSLAEDGFVEVITPEADLPAIAQAGVQPGSPAGVQAGAAQPEPARAASEQPA